MKLLIVDDEKYTRDGISKNIDFKSLGVGEVICCKNAASAISAAKEFFPDILLTDIRMPQMNGIELAKEIKAMFPECKIIFMSGYSDKEYLLSAVKLKAVNYVEKPISLEELSGAIKTAVDELNSHIRLNMLDKKAKDVIPVLKSEAALMLTKPKTEPEKLKNILEMAGIGDLFSGFVNVVLFKVYTDDFLLNEEFSEVINAASEKHGLKLILGQKSDDIYVAGLFFESRRSAEIYQIDKFCREVFKNTRADTFAAIGKTETIENAYKSYNNAVLGLNTVFYSGYNTVATSDTLNDVYMFDDELIERFRECLIKKDRDTAVRIVRKIAAEVREKNATLVSVTKNYFYKLVNEILKLNKSYKLNSDIDMRLARTLDGIHGANTLDELLFMVNQSIDMLFDNLNTEYENNTVWKIKQYIKENYRNELLSLSEISDYLDLNVSYASTVFKKEVGITINRYIIDYRLKEAKKLLLRHDILIKDIAKAVGFQNSNYFAKVFKKVEGIQPKEYREKHML